MNLRNVKRDVSLNNEELFIKAKSGCAESKEILFKNNVPLVKVVIKRLVKSISYDEYDEFLSIGLVGLTKAYTYFEISKNIKFSTYAVYCIKREINHHFRYNSMKCRSKYNTISIDEKPASDMEGHTYHEIVSNNERNDYDLVEESDMFQQLLLNGFSKRDIQILILRFKYEFTMKEIGEKLNVSKQAVNQVYLRCIKKLSKKIKNDPEQHSKMIKLERDSLIEECSIKSLRKKLNLTQKQLGEYIGYTRSQISGYEQKTQKPSPQFYETLEEFEKSNTYKKKDQSA